MTTLDEVKLLLIDTLIELNLDADQIREAIDRASERIGAKYETKQVVKYLCGMRIPTPRPSFTIHSVPPDNSYGSHSYFNMITQPKEKK